MADVWSLEQLYKKQKDRIKELETRMKYLEDYLGKLTKGNKLNEKLQDKKVSSSGVRTRRQVTAKS